MMRIHKHNTNTKANTNVYLNNNTNKTTNTNVNNLTTYLNEVGGGERETREDSG
jgi:hypothetical protein